MIHEMYFTMIHPEMTSFLLCLSTATLQKVYAALLADWTAGVNWKDGDYVQVVAAILRERSGVW